MTTKTLLHWQGVFENQLRVFIATLVISYMLKWFTTILEP